MAYIAVSVSTGVMKPLLEKLATLMGDKYKKLKGLREEVSFLECELSDMNALLEKMDDADELDPQAKKWRKDIIDMSYDIEDYIDNFMDRIGEANDTMGFLQKAYHDLRTFRDRHRLANLVQEIKTLVIKAGERRKRYMLDQCIPSTTRVIVDPRLHTLYKKSSKCLVGIYRKKGKIVRWVLNEQRQLKVMSIVGFGGLGKTTLANEIYREVGGKFNCKAFVSISQNPDIIKLLNSLMLQLGLQPYTHACELQDLINNIRKYLQYKKYFVIVDDLWDIGTWKIISSVFPQNNRYSRVMITTRIKTVATTCCGNHRFIHDMKPLSVQDSRKLFFDAIRESEDACTPDFKEVSSKILKKCGGLPLAIITMASMIACQLTGSKRQWAEYIQNSLDAKFATNTAYKDMMHILDFSYKNLPYYLKTCFLYLGTYPEDHKIRRVELVRRWVAEGFVTCSPGHDIWDLAESYFSELVDRSMIQPAYKDHDDIGMEVTHCRVHDMMLELILKKCREDNFISLIDDPKIMPKGKDNVRRLTIDLRRGEEGGIMVMARHLSRIRSLNIFSGKCRIPNLAEFRFMRLLFLYVHGLKMTIDLSGINHLTQLRYLKVIGGCGNEVLLPPQIKSLRLLETLDLSGVFEFRGLPEFVDVPRLSHVSVPGDAEVRLLDRIGKVKSLVTLCGFSLDVSSLESITGLGELTALSELIFTCSDSNSGGMMPLSTLIAALITSIEKLGNLRKLVLPSIGCCAMSEPSVSPLSCKIEELDLGLLIFSRVPRWIDSLHYLRDLLLGAKQIHQEDFNIIGTTLTVLVRLNLQISCIPMERIVIGGSIGFKVLKRFRFDCDGVSWLTFEVEAMPDLQELELGIDADKWDKATPEGLQHLPSLKRITVSIAASATTDTMALQISDGEMSVCIRCDAEMPAKEELMKGVFQKVADALLTRPAVNVGWMVRPKEIVRKRTKSPKGQSSVTQSYYNAPPRPPPQSSASPPPLRASGAYASSASVPRPGAAAHCGGTSTSTVAGGLGFPR